MKFLHHNLTPNGLLKKIALGTAIAGSALFNRLEAAPVNWSSFSEIVGTIPVQFKQEYRSTTSSSLPEKISGILYFKHPTLGDKAIGGFDLQNGQVSLSYFGSTGEAYVANTGVGADSDYNWKVFRDIGNGDYGTREGTSILDYTELLDPSKYTISGFSPYGSQNPGTFTFTTTISAPSTSALTALSMTTLGGGTNQVTFSVAVSNAVLFSINYKNSLTNATWESLGSYSKTGAVTAISDTNSVPQRFYRVVIP